MRLSELEKHALKHAALECFGSGTRLRLFGSRAQDSRKGGDIDLLIESTLADPADIAKAHTRFLSQIYTRLGEQKVDVLIDYPGRRSYPPIFRVAKDEGIVL
ncbi:nucleotidyltransferase domain-containing protein [Limnohabitans sp.]|uniref:nucleotidyltransferase domain-containing protein n=1 Tax=Limnohabitans sp. TaxID=1907725 RepID=UPI0031FCDC94